MSSLATLLSLLTLASEIFGVRSTHAASGHSYRSLGPSLPSGCLYEGRWYQDGSTVSTGEACLHCACSHGALSCRRRACAPLPDHPPHRCHILHRRGSCCPELHCPDGIILMEHGASARLEDELDVSSPASFSHACVEGGTVYAAGSAMRSTVACEQCFCLGGTRRCVRPRCLPPPSGCRPRTAPGACCPQRYYCEHKTTKPPEKKHPHDCKVEGKWITEGEKVLSNSNCSQCFCLRGVVQCQALSCAPPLLGCKPLLRPGECCAHQYTCDHKDTYESRLLALSTNALTSARNNNQESNMNTDATTKTTLASVYNIKNTQITSATKNHLISTTKVKRKTSDPPPENITTTTITTTTKLTHVPTTTKVTHIPTTAKVTHVPTTTNMTHVPKTTRVTRIPTTTKVTKDPTTIAKIISTTDDATSTTETITDVTSTEQPEGSVRIIVNGTINCTAELSSTSIPLNITSNDTEKINNEAFPRIPIIDVSNLEDHTFSANDLITDRTVNGNFDENESFVINVTSSLTTNNTKTSTKPPAVTATIVSLATDISDTLNTSKKTKGDYDYDYPQPTLPPSLPNLKIIPFVAADAVVDDEPPKATLTYPILEREDKFPVYYPTVETKGTVYTNRREDTYKPTQYPVFITDKIDQEYPSMAQDVDLTSTGYSNLQSDIGTASVFNTIPASSKFMESKKAVTQSPKSSTTFKVETPAINLFSPPVETEGGFIPKGPGIIHDFYNVFSSTPPSPAIPHLTTSMQLDIAKGECLSSDGRHISEGDTITLACSECTCAWGELHCSPRPCNTPPGCKRRPTSSNVRDQCCGELICEKDNKPTTTTRPLNPESVLIDRYNTTSDIKEIEIETALNIAPNKTAIQENKVYEVTNIINDTKTVANAGQITTKIPESTTALPVNKMKEPEPKHNQSLEYEDEEEDEGFSFGSVLKLLLSDSYETTTNPPKKQTTAKPVPPSKPQTTTKRPRPPLPSEKPTANPFVPLPVNPFTPPKISHSPINRIDHLVLGESTAIKKSTPRPVSTTPKLLTNRPTLRTTTQKIVIKQETTEKQETYTTPESPRPPGGLGPGLLKLAGCNIYGRMYRVGRIIAELSTPCQECWCTEFGVQCKQLKC